jgi:cyclic pyranopterin phosphate synthase
MISIYTDGSCDGNPGPGGWAAIIIAEDDKRVISGGERDTTNNRMEVLAAIKGLEATSAVESVVVFSDSQYLVNTMTKGWRRMANNDLWRMLDNLTANRTVQWLWVRGHSGDAYNEEANTLANREREMARQHVADMPKRLTHLDEKGKAQMVNVGEKLDSHREAVAKCSILMNQDVLEKISHGQVAKGDVFAVARIAGINAAKHTWEMIPLCHQIPITHAQVDLEADSKRSAVDIVATVRTTYKTGVEMEALVAATSAALTVYDMCKALDRTMHIEGVRLVKKSGGRSGEIVLE